ncbi:YopX family protein [Sinanaerobacter sp. ZZT-01]|uniref:YopX family protein n=1 Tax=Sinanaerobacter sp. ZZT-01 TaxID=3111540 RepID=UPI002D7A26D7|nr:YopX family protein [Sinanaerobacter sp. ZZT-01]WRR94199.1 YopX family protein [Sinanaerobacter sp. ZZT-01]
MIITAKIDIDVEESGLSLNKIKDNLIAFTRNLIVNGAENEEIGLTLLEVSYTEFSRKCTGKHDVNGELLYEGDILESLAGGQIIEIRYGKYSAYCPADKSVMDGVGFYAIAEGYPEMPIGDTETYAKKIGDIYSNPELAVHMEADI